MSSSAADTITRLYAALDAGDGATMAACYAPGATFRDPAFGALAGDDVGRMWRMLTSRATDLSVALEQHEAAGGTGSAHWIATYAFGPGGRRVVNDVRATFTFDAAGLITAHEDRFDLRAWGAQAMGPVAGVLGFTPLLGVLVQRKTAAQLEDFRAGER